MRRSRTRVPCGGHGTGRERTLRAQLVHLYLAAPRTARAAARAARGVAAPAESTPRPRALLPGDPVGPFSPRAARPQRHDRHRGVHRRLVAHRALGREQSAGRGGRGLRRRPRVAAAGRRTGVLTGAGALSAETSRDWSWRSDLRYWRATGGAPGGAQRTPPPPPAGAPPPA